MLTGFIDAISLVEYSDPDCLKSDDASIEMRVKTFEEYANFGLSVLSEETVYEMNPVQLADFILKQLPDEPIKIPDIIFE